MPNQQGMFLPTCSRWPPLAGRRLNFVGCERKGQPFSNASVVLLCTAPDLPFAAGFEGSEKFFKKVEFLLALVCCLG